MNRARRLVRVLPQLFGLACLLMVPLSAPPVAALTGQAVAQAPAVPEPPEPEPRPEPGPAAPSPDPEPEPTPGPTPAPDRPTPEPDQEPSAPEPTPGPTPPACEATDTECDKGTGWGFGDLLDIPGMVSNAITAFLGTLIEQAMKPLRELIADTLLAAPDVTKHADIKRLWTASMAITAGIYVLFVTAGGVTVMGYETVQTRYALKQIAPRLFLGIAAAATSLTVMGKTITLGNALTHAIMGTDMADAGQGLVERALPFSLFGPKGIAVYLLLLAVVELVLVIAVLVGFIVRIAVMALLAVLAPLALACHAHPLTDPVARLWWRGLAGCLVIQIGQSTTFILALKLFFAPGATALGIPKADQLGTLLAGLALFWVLFKIPGWTLQVVLRGTPIQQPHAPAPVRMLRHLAMYQLMGRYLPGGGHRPRPGGIRPGRGGGGPLRGPRPGGGVPGGPPGRRPGGGPGGAGGGPRRPGGGPGARGRAAPARGRARAGRPAAPRPHAPAAGGAPVAGAAPPGPAAPPAPALAPGPSPAPVWPGPPRGRAPQPRPRNTPPPRRPRQGPHAVPHPAQARRTRQLALPIPAKRVPARPARPVQGQLPIATPRVPRPPGPALPAAQPPPPATRAPAPRGRQLALPVPAPRVRVRPARPVQLRLPLEPPAPSRTPRR